MKSAREQISLMEDDGVLGKSTKKNGMSRSDIVVSFLITTIPMILFCGVLLGLVFHYQVKPGKSLFESSDHQAEANVYYVRLSGTVLIFIASWSSSLAPFLSGFILNLISYPMARQHVSRMRAQDFTRLPTPYQLALSLKFTSGGGFGALCSWIKYRARWPKQNSSGMLSVSARVTILVTIMSLLVFAADTWLHIATKTISLTLTSPVNGVGSYSMELVPNCLTSNNSIASGYGSVGTDPNGCSINPGGTKVFLMNVTQTNQVLSNTSETISVFNYGPHPAYAYLGRTSNSALANLDYTATTFGIQTQCLPVSQRCAVDPAFGAATYYNCSENFSGNIESQGFSGKYFIDDSMSDPDPIDGVSNPFYYGVAKLVLNPLPGATSDPELINTVHGEMAFVLLCTVNVYDIEYDLVDGKVARFVVGTSNDSTANVWESALATTLAAENSISLTLDTVATSATDAQNLADLFAESYSKIALAVGAQSVQLAPAQKIQARETMLVTKVPWAPLYSLIGANLLFALVGIISTVVAVVASNKPDVREAKAKLSIFGLVADRFERTGSTSSVSKKDEWFEEYRERNSARVGLLRHENGALTYASTTL